jgi:hypothetical protein
MDSLHLTTTRQRELLDLKDRQAIESEERERKSNMVAVLQIFIFFFFTDGGPK